MPSITNLDETDRADLLARLRKIEGQVKGIQKMIEDGRECVDVINQVAAMRAAATSMNAKLLETYALRCLTQPSQFGSTEQAVEAAVEALLRAGR